MATNDGTVFRISWRGGIGIHVLGHGRRHEILFDECFKGEPSFDFAQHVHASESSSDLFTLIRSINQEECLSLTALAMAMSEL